jgi:hypothetical protein
MSEHLATLFRSIAVGLAFVGLGGFVVNSELLISSILLAVAVTILWVVADIRKGNNDD